MKTRIFIVRHAETLGNIEGRLTGRKDYELTPKGELTADVLSQELKNINFDVAYCSTSHRTKNTIVKIAERNNLKVIELDDLCEMYFRKI